MALTGFARFTEAMTGPDHFTISLKADCNDWHSATARVDALRDVRWYRPAGKPQRLLHARISCADIVTGSLPHDCGSSTAPHDIELCVLRRHNLPAAYAALTDRVGGRQ